MKKLHEPFTKFFEEPTREKLRELIQFNTGEYNNLDFKKAWPESSKIAKHILAMANSGGGAIIVGVEENKEKELISCGIESLIDKATITTQLSSYVPIAIEYLIHDFTYKSSEYGELIGKTFQVLIVDYNPNILPLISLREGKNIIANTIYAREGTSSSVASNDQLQRLINKRIETNYNSSSEIELEEHLAQLKILFGKIDKFHYEYEKDENGNTIGVNSMFSKFGEMMLGLTSGINGKKVRVINDYYPEENYEYFISRLIEQKKKRIEKVLDI